MKTIEFAMFSRLTGYSCNKSGNQSGEYVLAETAKLLLEALKDACQEIYDLQSALANYNEDYQVLNKVAAVSEKIIKEHE